MCQDIYFQRRPAEYNAFAKDFAIINVFFGDSNAIGRIYMPIESFHYAQTFNSQNTKDTQKRRGLTSCRPLEDFVGFSSDSACSPLQRSFIGSRSFGSAEPFGEDEQKIYIK